MRDRIWITILDADRLSRYYGRLATTNRRMQFSLNLVVTLCSLAAATVLLVDVHNAVAATLFVVVAACTTLGIFAELSKKATIASHVAKECAKVKSEAVELWYDQDADDAMERALSLFGRLDDVTPIGFEQNEKPIRNVPNKLTRPRRMNSGRRFGGGHPPRPPEPAPPPPPPPPVESPD